jgi:hypothetical protein
VTLSERKQKPVRLTHEQTVRVERAAQSCGQTIQAFMLSAVMDRVEHVEAKREARKEARRAKEPPRGLGLGLRPREAAPPAVAPSVPPSVVVNVGQSANREGLVSRLAAYVHKGPPYGEETRRRVAIDIVTMTASDEERRVLLEELEAALAAPAPAPQGLDRIWKWIT